MENYSYHSTRDFSFNFNLISIPLPRLSRDFHSSLRAVARFILARAHAIHREKLERVRIIEFLGQTLNILSVTFYVFHIFYS